MPTDNNYWGNPQGQNVNQPQTASVQPEASVGGEPVAQQVQQQYAVDAQQVQQQYVVDTQQVQQQYGAETQQAPYYAQQAPQPYAAQTQAAQQSYAQPQPQSQPQPQPQAQAPAQPYMPAGAYANAVPYQQTAAPQQKSHGWIVAIVIVACFFLLSLFAIKSCSDAVNSMGSLATWYGSDSSTELEGDAIAIIDIDGTIQYDGSACSPEGLKYLLDEAEENSHIKGVVLRVNSGGGTATAGEEMAIYVRDFSKPIVVSSAAINASAAYEISSQADYIFVAKSTEIGAIGTAMEIMDLSGLFETLGISMDTIVSADQKDSSYGYRPLTDDERAYYQDLVNQINDVFVQNVADGRGMTLDQVEALATGMPFTGLTAVENGLADEVGTREQAIEKCAALADITDYTTTDLYFSEYDFSSLAYLLGEGSVDVDEIAKLLEASKNGNIK